MSEMVEVALLVARALEQTGVEYALGGSVATSVLASMMKVDFFIRGAEAFDASEFSRRVRLDLQPNAPIFIATTEDNLLRKLRWFRMGGEASDRQWRDILGLLRVSGDAIDLTYLRRWAKDLGVEDLLERALSTRGAV